MTPRVLIWLLGGLLLTAPSLSLAQEDRAKLVPKSPLSLPGLVWDSSNETQTPLIETDDEGSHFVTLKGSFSQMDHYLFLEHKTLPREKNGEFTIRLTIDAETKDFTLSAINTEGVVAKQEFSVLFADWKNYLLAAEEASSKSVGSKFHFLVASVSAVGLINSSGQVFTFMPAWTPYYEMGKIRIEFDLGVMPLRDLSSSVFYAIEYGLMGSYRLFKSISVQALIGMQYWTGQSLNYPVVGMNLNYHFNNKFLYAIDKLFLGYANFLAPGASTSEFKLGFGLAF